MPAAKRLWWESPLGPIHYSFLYFITFPMKILCLSRVISTFTSAPVLLWQGLMEMLLPLATATLAQENLSSQTTLALMISPSLNGLGKDFVFLMPKSSGFKSILIPLSAAHSFVF